jgi:PAP2 superfamily
MQATLRKIVPKLHYACTLLLVALAVPEVKRLHLPTHLDWRGNLIFYWVTLGTRSLLYAMIFCALALPLRETLGPFCERYMKEKTRIALSLFFAVLLLCLLPLKPAILCSAMTLFVIELVERSKAESISLSRKAVGILVPALYMFAGLTLVIIWNDIIVADRFPLSYDAFLNRIDTSILWGRSIPSLSHSLLASLPTRFVMFLDYAYFQMFPVVGGCLLMTAYVSYRRGMQFVGACLTAYYIALLIFFIWPSYGPYVFCSQCLATFPRYLAAYNFETSGMRSLEAVSHHKMLYLASGYYIAFPSLHVGLPVIAMWLMRGWRKVFCLLAAYNCVIVFAIITLQWHYVIDLVGGAAVGILALLIVSGPYSDEGSVFDAH